MPLRQGGQEDATYTKEKDSYDDLETIVHQTPQLGHLRHGGCSISFLLAFTDLSNWSALLVNRRRLPSCGLEECFGASKKNSETLSFPRDCMRGNCHCRFISHIVDS